MCTYANGRLPVGDTVTATRGGGYEGGEWDRRAEGVGKRIPNGIFFASPQRCRGINVITAGVEPLALNKQ